MPLSPTGFKADRHDLVTVAPGNPAAGANLVWPCPNNRVVRVVGVSLTYVTDATVANRNLVVAVYDGTNYAVASPSFLLQAASLTWYHWWAVGIESLDMTAQLSLYMPLSTATLLKTGESLHIMGVIFADQISNVRIRYHEWNED